MKYKETNIRGALKLDGYLLSIREDDKLLFLSKDNFEIVKQYNLEGFPFAVHLHNGKIVLSDLNTRHLEILPIGMKAIEHSGYCYPISENVQYCPKDKNYLIQDHENNKLIKFKRNFKLENRVFRTTLLECSLHESSGSFIRSTNLLTREENWRIELEGKVVRLDYFGNNILLECYDKSGFTIVLNIENGQECWRREMSYVAIDRNSKTVLFGGNSITEIVVSSGEIKTELIVKPNISSGCVPHFTDDDGIYYLSNDHSFGKVNRNSGKIKWEFDLIDSKGAKRKLSDWFLLGNGNLVLQSMPNHPNGDLTCIFNPNENLNFSKVKSGERIS
ncbi:MAG: PQQ-like beta-propeller repeat protein [Saprospiraceae bacterium]|nr:PQQ-like beta-propeller repeat protein [Saprospiraceae bacterium]